MAWPQELKSSLLLAVGSGDGAGSGRLTVLGYSRSRTCCACSRCGMGGPVEFFLSSVLSSFFFSLSTGRWLDLDLVVDWAVD